MVLVRAHFCSITLYDDHLIHGRFVAFFASTTRPESLPRGFKVRESQNGESK